MTVTANQLTSGAATGVTSQDTASISPGANKLILVSIYNRNINPAVQPTLSGNGLTYVLVRTETLTIHRVSIYRAMGASPGAGAITIDCGGTSQDQLEWSVTEFDGVDTSGTNGSGAIVQSGGAQDSGGTTSMTITLAGFGSTENAAYGSIRHGAPITEGSGFTELSEVTTYTGFQSEWKINDNTVDWSFSNDGSFAFAEALEIKAATITPKSVTDSGTGTDVVTITLSIAITDSGIGTDEVTAEQTASSITDLGLGIDNVIYQQIATSITDSGEGIDIISNVKKISFSELSEGIDVVKSIFNRQLLNIEEVRDNKPKLKNLY